MSQGEKLVEKSGFTRNELHKSTNTLRQSRKTQKEMEIYDDILDERREEIQETIDQNTDFIS